MIQKGLTGKQLVNKIECLDEDIFGLVREGLQPYNEYWKPIPPPGSGDMFYEMMNLKEKKESIENRYPIIKNIDVLEFHELQRNRRIDLEGKLEKIAYEDGTDSEIRAEYFAITSQIERMEIQCLYLPSWINYALPKTSQEIKAALRILLDAHYKIEDILELENNHKCDSCVLGLSGSDNSPQENAALQATDSTNALNRQMVHAEKINFFRRESNDFWKIGFEGEKATIRHLDGIYYIAHLLNAPGTPISCLTLQRSLSVISPGEIMSDDMAIAQGLFSDHLPQSVNTPTTKKEYQQKYAELDNELHELFDLPDSLRTAETELQIAELENEINAIIKVMNEGSFAKVGDKKVQTNIHNRIKDACDAIRKVGMKKLGKHLQKNIQADHAYGKCYTGQIEWDINL